MKHDEAESGSSRISEEMSGILRNLQEAKKLDGVGPVDNRPSTNKLHHFVRKLHVTHDMRHMTRDT